MAFFEGIDADGRLILAMDDGKTQTIAAGDVFFPRLSVHRTGFAMTDTNDLVFIPLGGVGEIGMNLALYGYGPEAKREYIMVDCGVTFPGPDLPGADLVLPDISFALGLGKRLKPSSLPIATKTITER